MAVVKGVESGTDGVVPGLFAGDMLGEPDRVRVGVETASAGVVNPGVGLGRQPANCPMSETNKIPIKNVLLMRVNELEMLSPDQLLQEHRRQQDQQEIEGQPVADAGDENSAHEGIGQV